MRSLPFSLKQPYGWNVMPFNRAVERSQESGTPDARPLSVFLDQGVVPRASREDNFNRLGADLTKYLVVRKGDIVFNKLRTWQGGLGVSKYEGIVSPAYFVCRPRSIVEPRYLHHLLRSRTYLEELTRISKWMPPSQFDISWDDLRVLPVLAPPLPVQRRIADYLDREAARIDALIAAKRRMVDLLEEHRVAAAHATITGVGIPGPRRPPPVDWLGSLPEHWRITSLGSLFEVKLGRMLSPERTTGPYMRPYIRNINVRWGHVDVTDLAEMDFPPAEQKRYLLRSGDLMVNEGGAGIGRSAIWNGQVPEIFYQKSVHRIRARGVLGVRWLLEWMRVVVDRDVFQVEGNLATIPHVPAEALRRYPIPLPPISEADALLARLEKTAERDAALRTATESQIALLQERRLALITAAVTGQLDIPEAA